MDLKTLASQSPQILTVIQSIKDDPNFLSELKEHPQEALNKIGVELNEEELALVQKIESLSVYEEQAIGIFTKLKGFLGMH